MNTQPASGYVHTLHGNAITNVGNKHEEAKCLLQACLAEFQATNHKHVHVQCHHSGPCPPPTVQSDLPPNSAAHAHAGNAFAVYPASPVKSAAIVTMVVDQLTAYGLFVHPLCVMWEKLLRIHYRSLLLRLPARLPIGEQCNYILTQPVGE